MRRLRTAITFIFLVFCVFARSTRSAPFLWKGHTRYLARTVQETPGRQLYDIKIKSGTEKYDVQTIAGIHGMTVKSGATVEFSTQGDSDGVYDLEAWNVTVFGNMILKKSRLVIRGEFRLACEDDKEGGDLGGGSLELLNGSSMVNRGTLTISRQECLSNSPIIIKSETQDTWARVVNEGVLQMTGKKTLKKKSLDDYADTIRFINTDAIKIINIEVLNRCFFLVQSTSRIVQHSLEQEERGDNIEETLFTGVVTQLQQDSSVECDRSTDFPCIHIQGGLLSVLPPLGRDIGASATVVKENAVAIKNNGTIHLQSPNPEVVTELLIRGALEQDAHGVLDLTVNSTFIQISWAIDLWKGLSGTLRASWTTDMKTLALKGAGTVCPVSTKDSCLEKNSLLYFKMIENVKAADDCNSNNFLKVEASSSSSEMDDRMTLKMHKASDSYTSVGCPSIFLTLNVGNCLPGTHVQDNSCARCLPGKYSSIEGSASCTECEVGTFQDQLKSSSCKSCPAGLQQPEKGKSECVACKAGTYQKSPSECKLCERGKYQDMEASTSCRACRPGTATGQEGALSCEHCAPGKYQGQEGKTLCLECDNGSYSKQHATECSTCPPGSYADGPGMPSCKLCRPGTSTPLKNLSNPQSTGAQSCVPCAVGTFADVSGAFSCKLCALHTFASQQASTSCKPCPSGTFQPDLGQTECLKCPNISSVTTSKETQSIPAIRSYEFQQRNQDTEGKTAETEMDYCLVQGQEQDEQQSNDKKEEDGRWIAWLQSVDVFEGLSALACVLIGTGLLTICCAFFCCGLRRRKRTRRSHSSRYADFDQNSVQRHLQVSEDGYNVTLSRVLHSRLTYDKHDLETHLPTSGNEVCHAERAEENAVCAMTKLIELDEPAQARPDLGDVPTEVKEFPASDQNPELFTDHQPITPPRKRAPSKQITKGIVKKADAESIDSHGPAPFPSYTPDDVNTEGDSGRQRDIVECSARIESSARADEIALLTASPQTSSQTSSDLVPPTPLPSHVSHEKEDTRRFKYLMRGGVPRYAVTSRETFGSAAQTSEFSSVSARLPAVTQNFS